MTTATTSTPIAPLTQSPLALAVVVRRLIRAPLARVFAAWSDPRTMATWMRPRGFAESTVELDFRVGGAYRIVMHDPRGGDYEYWHEGRYSEIRAPHRLAFTWRSHSVAGESQVEIDFRALDGNLTELVLHHRQLPDASSVANHGAGWHEILGSCAQHLSGDTGEEDGLHLELAIAAPAAAVYAALTTLDGLRAWWTPNCEREEVHSGPGADGSPHCSAGAGLVGGVGAQTTVRFGQTWKVLRTTALTPDTAVRWRCLASHIAAPGLERRDEWTGTLIAFDLEASGPNTTRLRFTHHGLVPPMGCLEMCTGGWRHFLGSLKRYAETGCGTPWGGEECTGHKA